MGTVWCCIALYNDSQGNGFDLVEGRDSQVLYQWTTRKNMKGKKLIFEVRLKSVQVENFLLRAMRKTKFIKNGLFDVPLNSHVDININLLQPVRRITIFSFKVLDLQSVLH